jgi:hypothetical protein
MKLNLSKIVEKKSKNLVVVNVNWNYGGVQFFLKFEVIFLIRYIGTYSVNFNIYFFFTFFTCFCFNYIFYTRVHFPFSIIIILIYIEFITFLKKMQ